MRFCWLGLLLVASVAFADITDFNTPSDRVRASQEIALAGDWTGKSVGQNLRAGPAVQPAFVRSQMQKPIPCNILLAMSMQFLDSYFASDMNDPKSLNNRSAHDAVDLEAAGKNFTQLMSGIGAQIIEAGANFFVRPEGWHEDSRLTYHRAATPLKGEGPLKFHSVEASALPVFYWLYPNQMPMEYTLDFRSYPVTYGDIYFYVPNHQGHRMVLDASRVVRRLQCKLRALVPLQKNGGPHNILQIPFEIRDCKHERINPVAYSDGSIQTEYWPEEVHRSMSRDALEHADTMALEGGFEWKSRASHVFARGVVNLQATRSLRAENPNKAEYLFVSIYNDEPMSIDILRH